MLLIQIRHGKIERGKNLLLSATLRHLKSRLLSEKQSLNSIVQFIFFPRSDCGTYLWGFKRLNFLFIMALPQSLNQHIFTIN